MRISILSMQRIKNNGSFLQAYALYTVLREISGQDIEYIDFDNELLVEKKRNQQSGIKELLRRIKHTFIPKYWGYIKTLKYNKKFCNEWANWLSFINIDRQKYNYPNGRYDLVVIGSDEVFNICQFTDEGVNVPWTLLGDGIETKRLISYAASCGQTDLNGLKEIGCTTRFSELLNKFNQISVRDENTFDVVSNLSNIKPRYDIDPVLLLEKFPKDEKYKRLPYKYLLIYAYTRRISDKKEIDAIKKFAKSNHLKTVCVNCFQAWADKSIVSSAFALLQYFKDAECVVTDTFHGTVFSLHNNVPFVTIIRKSNKNKLQFLLNQFGLESREIINMDDLQKKFTEIIDFKEVNEKLATERKNATEYLKQQVENAKGDVG